VAFVLHYEGHLSCTESDLTPSLQRSSQPDMSANRLHNETNNMTTTPSLLMWTLYEKTSGDCWIWYRADALHNAIRRYCNTKVMQYEGTKGWTLSVHDDFGTYEIHFGTCVFCCTTSVHVMYHFGTSLCRYRYIPRERQFFMLTVEKNAQWMLVCFYSLCAIKHFLFMHDISH